MIAQKEAQTRLEQYHNVFADIMYHSWDAWKEQAPMLLNAPYKRTARQVVYNIAVEKAKTAFANEPGIHIVEEHESILLVFNDDLAVRFKKLDGSLRPSSYPTSRQCELNLQLPLPGIPDCERIIIGYVPDELEKDILVHVVYAQGDEIVWHYPLERPVEAIPLFAGNDYDDDSRVTLVTRRGVADGRRAGERSLS